MYLRPLRVVSEGLYYKIRFPADYLNKSNVPAYSNVLYKFYRLYWPMLKDKPYQDTLIGLYLYLLLISYRFHLISNLIHNFFIKLWLDARWAPNSINW